MLEQLEGSHEGFDAGAVAALRQSRSVIGSLADRIRVPDRFVTAVENALGHNLQLVLTEQPSSAQEILADLNANKSGRASVAALAIQQYKDEKQLAFEGDMAPASGPVNELQSGQMVHAMSVIQAEPTVEPLLKSLLGRTFIASDLVTATAQIQNGHAGCDFVTLGGDLLNRHGIYTGGYLNGKGNGRAPSSILGRKNQITELQAELATPATARRGSQPQARRAVERADGIAGQPAAGANGIAPAGSGHRHPRGRIQGAAKFLAPAEPEDRDGDVRGGEPGRPGTRRLGEARGPGRALE